MGNTRDSGECTPPGGGGHGRAGTRGVRGDRVPTSTLYIRFIRRVVISVKFLSAQLIVQYQLVKNEVYIAYVCLLDVLRVVVIWIYFFYKLIFKSNSKCGFVLVVYGFIQGVPTKG
jgi:hypothetical protein